MMGLNSYLKGLPISVLSATKVGGKFNARFDAIERHYLYRILIRRAPPSLNAFRVWHLKNELDYEAMNIALKSLSSSKTLCPLLVKSLYTFSQTSMISFFFGSRQIIFKSNGVMLFGQTKPFSDVFCSTAAATILEIPMP